MSQNKSEARRRTGRLPKRVNRHITAEGERPRQFTGGADRHRAADVVTNRKATAKSRHAEFINIDLITAMLLVRSTG
ncbi:MAG TPA: hypothetical protein VGG27_06700 [Magnetospirillaceae bacterium]|jgi:hypothetical protein